MGIMNKLDHGIYPIASRRHQPRDSGFQQFSKDWDKWESITVIVGFVSAPFTAAIMSVISDKFSYGESLLLMIFLAFYLWFAMARSN